MEGGEEFVLAGEDRALPPQAREFSFHSLELAPQGVFIRWRDRHGSISEGYFGVPPKTLDASGTPVEADGHLPVGDDDRHPALVAGVFQHVGHRGLVPQDVHVFHCTTFPGIGFTSRLGVGSAVLAEDPHAAWHIPLL